MPGLAADAAPRAPRCGGGCGRAGRAARRARRCAPAGRSRRRGRAAAASSVEARASISRRERRERSSAAPGVAQRRLARDRLAQTSRLVRGPGPRPAGRADRHAPAPAGRAHGRGPGRRRRASRSPVAAPAVEDQRLDLIQPRADRLGSASGAASRSASSRRRHWSRCGRSPRAASRHGRRRGSLCSSRLRRVAGSISIAPSRLDPARTVQARQQALLGELEIAEDARRPPRARRARTPRSPSSVATPERLAQAALGGDAVEARVRQRGELGAVPRRAGRRARSVSRCRQPGSRPAPAGPATAGSAAALDAARSTNAPVEMSTRASPSSPPARATATSQLLRRALEQAVLGQRARR